MATTAERVARHRARKKSAAAELLFVRHDWQLFLHPERLPQKAGCTAHLLRAVALKELADNALDQGGTATLDQAGENSWEVTDDGPGLDANQIARLFAVNRPLTSSKLLRRPTRGAVGNGLRVVTSVALASGGNLHVESRGCRYRIEVDGETGTTSATEQPCNAPCRIGTKVTIAFGPVLPRTDDDGYLAREALRFPGHACEPFRSHVGWYHARAWDELAAAAPPGTTLAQLLVHMGIASDDRRPAQSVRFAEVEELPLPPAPRLLPRGDGGLQGYAYARETESGALVECWATAHERCAPTKATTDILVFVNRTPVIGRADVTASGWLTVAGSYVCQVERAQLGCSYSIELSVTAPYVPIVTDGKTPAFGHWSAAIAAVLGKAMRGAYRVLVPPRRRGDVKEAAWEVMAEAYMKASGDGSLPANARQVMYAARPLIAELLGPERDPVDDKYFTQVLLPDYIALHEVECADWDVVYDARGHLTEPHTGIEIPLGTVAVRDYLRPRANGHDVSVVATGGGDVVEPRDRYRTVLFIEKEGFGPLLQAARISERFDCAVMSTKGMSVVAARHLLDRLARDDVTVLIAHDFDRAGMAIKHTLATDSRRYVFEREPEVVDLGLRLAEAQKMGLQDEPAPDAGPDLPALLGYGCTRAEIEFLIDRKRRIELNAMTAPQFVAWIVAGLERHGAGKVVPADDKLEKVARMVAARAFVRERSRELERQARAHAAMVELPEELAARVWDVLAEHPEMAWEQAVEHIMRGEG